MEDFRKLSYPNDPSGGKSKNEIYMGFKISNKIEIKYTNELFYLAAPTL